MLHNDIQIRLFYDLRFVSSFIHLFRTASTTALILVGVVAVVVWTVATGAWCYYAYTRPTSPSGRWLIEVGIPA